jgi:hypothetical protein
VGVAAAATGNKVAPLYVCLFNNVNAFALE